jgi:outer membrane receptor protein involved in Fe transport
LPINAPAIQLGTLFDVEAVNILRGPQGSGLARNASAGAIKIYSRKPSGEFGGFLRADFGNYSFLDFEGAIDAPIYEDLVASRFAFRLTQRDGTMHNRCGSKPPGWDDEKPGERFCGEPPGETIPEGLADDVNDLGNWAARGTLLFQPTLDITLLLSAHGSRRDELSRLGQSYGTRGFFCVREVYTPGAPSVDNCIGLGREFPEGARINGLLGGLQAINVGYQAPEVVARLIELDPCFEDGTCGFDRQLEDPFANRGPANAAKIKVAKELAQELDSEPWAGDFNRTGSTTNDTYGGHLTGDVELPGGIQLTSITGYETYDRTIDIDLDFSPQTLFHLLTNDGGWQVTQDIRLFGEIDAVPVRWDVGGWFLREQLDVEVENDLGVLSQIGVGRREYQQNIYSAAGYAHLSFDFWDDFTLDGGFRYNWERKDLDYLLEKGTREDTCRFGVEGSCRQQLEETWSDPTGTIRLTYQFQEDTLAFWKYTRGWKPGHFNATGSPVTGVSTAKPETIDAFEVGLRGSWLDGRLNLDASIFYYNYTDYQIFVAQQFIGTNPEFVILNANDAEVYGSEVNLAASPWSGALANVRFGWLEGQFLDFLQIQQKLGPGGTVILRELQNSGNPLLNSPRFKVSLTAEQTLQLGRWGSIMARYDATWTDTSYFDATQGHGIPNTENMQFLPEDTIAQPAFWLHHLRLSYRLPNDQIEIAGWARNFMNKPYKTFAFDASTFNNTSIYFVGDPRTIGASVPNLGSTIQGMA